MTLNFPKLNTVQTFTDKSLPVVVIILPVNFSLTRIDGMALKFSSPTDQIWQIVTSPEAKLSSIAQLLAILTLDHQESLIQSNLMPSKPSGVTLLNTGEMRQGRDKKFAPWVQKEVNRLSEVFLSQHQSYIANIKDALGGGTNLFRPIPDGFILRDRTDQNRLGPPPPIVKVDLSNSERVRDNLRQGLSLRII